MRNLLLINRDIFQIIYVHIKDSVLHIFPFIILCEYFLFGSIEYNSKPYYSPVFSVLKKTYKN